MAAYLKVEGIDHSKCYKVLNNPVGCASRLQIWESFEASPTRNTFYGIYLRRDTFKLTVVATRLDEEMCGKISEHQKSEVSNLHNCLLLVLPLRLLL